MRRQKKNREPASTQGQSGGGASEAAAWSPPGGNTAPRRPTLRSQTRNPTRNSERVSSYPQPGAGAKGDPNRTGQPKTTSYPQTAGNVGHRGYQAIN